MPIYRIAVTRKAAKGLAKLPIGLQEKAAHFIENVLADTPLQRIPGKTKMLQGKLRGIYQYDLSRGDRIWWRVNETNKVVTILYIGAHPKDTE